MILILISIIVAGVIAAVIMHYGVNRMDSIVAALGGASLALAAGFAAVMYAFTSWSWFAADYRSQIINREYGTNYTQQEIFWASDVIDTVRELDRKRYEVNGDFRRQTADSKSARDQRSHGTDQHK